jgi:hypothetical protein|tara:strand:+ start:1095 stop:1487 length:393 start_codon:yes stop_codon:yes gene_type:complete
MKTSEFITEMDCWDGYKKDGTQKGTGKNKGKRVNKCVPAEAVTEADRPLPQDFVPEPVVAQTIKDLGPGLDPMANGFYDLSYGKLLSNYLAQETPEIKKKFNMSWNLAWANQMRELYSREYGGYQKTPKK